MKYRMLSCAAMMAMAAAAGAAAQPAERWIALSADREGEYFYDPRSVERFGGMIRLRVRMLVRPGRAGDVRSAVIRVELNCGEQAVHFLGFEAFGENGALLRSGDTDDPRLPPERIRSGTSEEILYRRLCPASLVRPIPPPPPITYTVMAPPMAPMAPPMPPPPPPPPPIDPAGRVVGARPLTPFSAIITGDDYPAAALRAEAQGTVRVALAVSRRGRVTGCTVTSSSGSSALDAATCRLLTERARFAPARNARGRTVADTVRTAVTWAIPEEPEPAEEPAQPAPEQS